jgi:hypothetical protein
LAGKKTRGKTYLYVILYNLLYFVNSPCFLPAILHFSSNRQVKCDGRLILYASCNSPGNAQARLGTRHTQTQRLSILWAAYARSHTPWHAWAKEIPATA